MGSPPVIPNGEGAMLLWSQNEKNNRCCVCRVHHTQHTHNLFQVHKKKKKKVLFVAPGNQARVNVHRKRLRKGAPVMHDHNGKMYKGTVVEKEGDGQVLIAYPDFPGQYQKYKGEDTELYVKCT